MTNWVYIRQPEERLWTTGFYRPDGTFEPDRDFTNPEQAAARVAWLNGAGRPGSVDRLITPRCQAPGCSWEADWLMPRMSINEPHWTYVLVCDAHHEDWWDDDDPTHYPKSIRNGYRLVPA